MKLIIDRFEGNLAVCENENLETINLLEYPDDAKEGDCLVLIDGKYVIDNDSTEKRRENAQNLLKSLFKKQ